VEVGTRQGSRHGRIGLESNGKAGRSQKVWAMCSRQETIKQAEGVDGSGVPVKVQAAGGCADTL
jgi:hypothetical protein